MRALKRNAGFDPKETSLHRSELTPTVIRLARPREMSHLAEIAVLAKCSGTLDGGPRTPNLTQVSRKTIGMGGGTRNPWPSDGIDPGLSRIMLPAVNQF